MGDAEEQRMPDLNPPKARGAVFKGYYRNLPHWRLEGATYFVTWRINPSQGDLSVEERSAVQDALRHFGGERYDLLAHVVMNDHVHVLVQPFEEFGLEQTVHSWKSFSARELQRKHGRRGSVWLREYFDRVVRDEKEFLQKLNYVLGNPWKRWPDLKEYPWVGCHERLVGTL
jgi:REP element-mobilizing transposase RayT